jgi:chromate transporter
MQTQQQEHGHVANAGQLFLIFAKIGLQSFGGGASTTFLIQNEFTVKRDWMTMEDYAQLWNLCLFAPGINLIALTILIGQKLGGVTGIIGSMLGLLVPSAAITCLLAAGFKQVEYAPSTQAVLQGVVPATAGIMLLVGLNFARPRIQQAYKDGPFNLIVSLVLIIACTLAITLQVPVFIVLIGTALCGVLCFTRPLFKQHADKEGGQ